MAESFEVFEGEFAGEVAVERKRGRESDAEFRKRGGGERVVIK